MRKTREDGLIVFRRRPWSRVGAFCVKKQNGCLSLVIHCRATNRRLKPMPHLPRGTGAAWADVCLTEVEDARFSLSDIKDCLYGCWIPVGLSRYFALLDVEKDFVRSLREPLCLVSGVASASDGMELEFFLCADISRDGGRESLRVASGVHPSG